MKEAEWWDGLDDEEAVVNTLGFPPYDVEQTAQRFLDLLGDCSESTVVDIGCGLGVLTREIAKHCQSVIGLDAAPSMIERASMTHVANVSYMVVDEPLIPFGVDKAFSHTVFQHLPDDVCLSYIRALKNRLSPGGVFVLQTVVGADFDQFLDHVRSVDQILEWFADWASVEYSVDSGWIWVVATT